MLELIEEARLADPAYRDVAVRIVGIPADRFVEHGSVDELRRLLRLDAPASRGRSARPCPDAGDARARRSRRGRGALAGAARPDARTRAADARRPVSGGARPGQHEMIRVCQD